MADVGVQRNVTPVPMSVAPTSRLKEPSEKKIRKIEKPGSTTLFTRCHDQIDLGCPQSVKSGRFVAELFRSHVPALLVGECGDF